MAGHAAARPSEPIGDRQGALSPNFTFHSTVRVWMWKRPPSTSRTYPSFMEATLVHIRELGPRMTWSSLKPYRDRTGNAQIRCLAGDSMRFS